jgi:hypothetical protein
MGLPASGNISLKNKAGTGNSIEEEVYGAMDGTTDRSFLDVVGDSNPSVGSAPVSFSDFYGFTQTLQGRLYGNSISVGNDSDAYITGVTGIFRITDGGGETLLWTSRQGENTSTYLKKATGSNYTSGDARRVDVYRRTKQTSGSWSLDTTYLNYDSSLDIHSTDYSTYDYKFEIQ